MTVLVHPVNPKYVRVKGDWGSYQGHKGRDYGWISVPVFVPASREVRAAAPGKVALVYTGDGYNRGWGRLVIIQHTAKAFTAYAHFKKNTITVKVGDIVASGDLLGIMGTSGDTHGTVHLHFEVRIDGIGERFRVKPAPYFDERLPGSAIVPGPAALGDGKTKDGKTKDATTSGPATKTKTVKQVVTAVKGLNLRGARSTQAPILATFPRNTVVTTSGAVVNGFVRTSKGAKKGYCDARFLVWRSRTTAADLNLRERPSLDGTIITTLSRGTAVTILEVDGNTDTARWARVHAGIRTGWVSRRFLS